MTERHLPVAYIMFSIGAVLHSPTPASAQETLASPTATGRATAAIVEPLRVQAVRMLNFGCITLQGAGTVSVSPTSNAAIYDGGARQSNVGEDCIATPAEFLVSGENGREYRFQIAKDLVARNENNDAELPVTEIATASGGAPLDSAYGRLDAAGQDRLTIGGTLLLTADATPGRYVAEISVTVSYN